MLSDNSLIMKAVRYLRRYSYRFLLLGACLSITMTLYLFLDVQDDLQDKLHRQQLKPFDVRMWMDELYEVGWAAKGSACQFPVSNANVCIAEIYKNTEFQVDTADRYIIPRKDNIVKSRETNDDDMLNVIVVPHSHNDAGWVKTLDEYYIDQTKYILGLMVEKLTKYPDMTFVWAETVFLWIWWSDLEDDMKAKVRRLIQREQLEIVSGGWVMPDEACTHYSSIIEQLIEGHQWLMQNLNIRPSSAWSIDVFGHSSTAAYLWHQAGLENMVIQRVHQGVKSKLAEKQNLEFHWRQPWDNKGSADILCHVMPFMLYSHQYSCGPDPFTCIMFDFRNLPGELDRKIRSKNIDEKNIESQATILYQQYKKKADLYKYDTILVPLGDDFRFDKAMEWDQQYTNYMKLFNYMKSRKDWKINVKFGTLKEYFSLIRTSELRLSTILGSKLTFPLVTGDFLPYSDKNGIYWTGFYTSRPFIKRFNREVEFNLRAAESLTTFANILSKYKSHTFQERGDIFTRLQQARRHLSVVQHHDAITGTSREYVMEDFERKLYSAYIDSQSVIEKTLRYLLSDAGKSSAPLLEPAVIRKTVSENADNKVISITEYGTRVVFFNPVPHFRREIVQLLVDSDNVQIQDDKGSVIPCQLNPYWQDILTISDSVHEIAFPVNLAPMQVLVYTITKLSKPSKHLYPAGVILYNALDLVIPKTSKLITFRPDFASPIILQNRFLRISVSQRNGLLQQIVNRTSNEKLDLKMRFAKYSSRGSGTYIFFPKTPETVTAEPSPIIHVIKGHLMTELHVFHGHIQQKLKIFNGDSMQSRVVHVENLVDIKQLSDVDVFMRLETNLNRPDTRFYTDENGFQWFLRENSPYIPLGGHVYPFTTMSFLEDSKSRLTIHTGQPLGIHNDYQYIDVMLDRTLVYDDYRGLGESLQDNKPVKLYFMLQFESRTSPHNPATSSPLNIAYPSLLSSTINAFFQNPVVSYFAVTTFTVPYYGLSNYSPFKQSFPCDVALVSMRNMVTSLMAENGTGVIVHRLGNDCSFSSRGLQKCYNSDGTLSLSDVFSDQLAINNINKVSLSFLSEILRVSPDSLSLSHMEVATYHITWK